MAKGRRRRGKGLVDRDVIVLTSVALLLGFAVGFALGRRSALMPKPGPEKPAVERIKVAREKKERAAPFFAFPSAKKRLPKIAIVIDDVGNHKNIEHLLWQLPKAVTLAILPRLSHSEFFAKQAKKKGYDFILHQPMEPLRALEERDPGMIMVRMSDEEIRSTLAANLKTVPRAMGMNNHRGSFATQDRRVMRVLLGELKKRHLFFLDSATTPLSVADEEARSLGTPYVKRNVFLDNEIEPDYIHEQFEQLIQAARKEGAAVGIGHYKPGTLIVLKEELDRLRERSVELVPLKKLLS